MATSARTVARAAILVALGTSCACKPIADRCRAGTLLVAVSLEGGAVDADTLTFDVALDGGTPAESGLTHVPGQAIGNVEVAFPHGYPTGSIATVTVQAFSAGALVGSGSASATLTAGCQATTLTISATNDDGGHVDDHAAPGDDLATSLDLSPPPDLRPLPPDMACPGGGVELCFNGLDDDCDGHTDCDDPDCAPVAVCVPPATGTFTYGTEEPKSGACPSGTTSAPIYSNSDPTGGGCNSSCSCNAGGCSATINRLNDTCPGGTNLSFLATVTTTCNSPTDLSGMNNWRASAPTGTLSCSQAGSATPVTPAVVPSALQCTDNAAPVAGGCSGGNVCVPRGTKQCVMANGSATCPSGYASQATWFTSFTDSRTCSCSCAAGGSGCAGAKVTGYSSSSCSGSGTPIMSDVCSNDFDGLKVAGGCNLTVTTNNPLVFNGQRTVCCQ